MTSTNYKIVVNIVFLNGDEEYVIWEPLMYADMLDSKTDLHKLFYSTPEAIRTPPLEVHFFLYHNPTITTISQNIGDKMVIKQLLVGRRICYINSL